MSTAIMTAQSAELSPRLQARVAGVFYLLNIITAPIAFYGDSRPRLAFWSGLAATAFYIAVTILFYKLFKPVNKRLSLTAAVFSLIGCAPGIFGPLHITLYRMNSLVFFGFYCVLIGYLILKSSFLPRILGVLMVLAGLGWLTFIWAPLAKYLSPYNYYPGGIGEGLLCLWLLVVGLNAQRWKGQASAAGLAAS